MRGFSGLILLMVAVGASAVTPEERAAKLSFEQLYGPTMRKVIASRPTEDDLALAGELLDAAKAVTTTPEMKAELCDAVFLLAAREPAGYDVAITAMELLAQAVPDRAASSRDKAIQMLRRAMAKPAEAQAAATKLSNYLTLIGLQRAAASDYAGAAKLYAQALKAAEDGKLVDTAGLKSRLEAAQARERLELRVEALTQQVLSDPNNVTANADLLRIYLVDKDDPITAARFAKPGVDEKLRRMVMFASTKLDLLTPSQCMEVAVWYETLSEESAGAKLAMLRRARAFYDQFLLSEQPDKVLEAKALVAVARLRDTVGKLAPDEGKSLAPVNDEGWADLLAGLELARYRVSGSWKKEDPGVVVAAGDDVARLMLAASAECYDLAVTFNRLAGEGTVGVILPVGDRAVRLSLGDQGGKSAGLYSLAGEDTDSAGGVVTNKTTTPISELVSSKEYKLEARVVVNGDKASIAAKLDGQALFTWSGSRSDLSLSSAWTLRDSAAIGLAARKATVHFAAAQLRSLRGDARFIAKPPTLAERGIVLPADGDVNLLEIWSAGKDVLAGAWTREKDSLLHEPGRETGRILLPIMPIGDYRLRVPFTVGGGGGGKGRGAGGVVVNLPVGERGVLLMIGGGKAGDLSGLSLVDDKDFTSNDSTTTTSALKRDQRYVLEARVTTKAGNVRIEADLDGAKLLRWEGDGKRLAAPAAAGFGDGKSLGVGCGDGIDVESPQLAMINGKGEFTHKPKKPAVVDSTPVDFARLIDARRDAVAGPWTFVDEKLATTVLAEMGTAAFSLPVVPQGDYELKFKYIRTAGRPVTRIYLPVAGAELALGASDGKYTGLSMVAAPNPALLAGSGSGALRLVNNVPYAVRVLVETKGDESKIDITLDGKSFVNWKGRRSLFAPSNATPGSDASRIGISVYNPQARSSIVITDLELKMLTGTVKKIQ